MYKPIIFLDIDGVLNDHTKLPSGYCGIQRDKVDLLNWILESVPDCQIVISSAWRYLVLRGDMTVKGIEYLLLVHGVCCCGRVAGCTVADADICNEPDRFDSAAWSSIGLIMRAGQIAKWLSEYVAATDGGEWRGYAVIDDLPLAVPNLVKTDGKAGLTKADAQRVVEILKGKRHGQHQ